ncbi:S41 family peptidase [Risungbinella massiliensis]|uniref:S41 family peptidase n=1 Tax=Risungbinella massiliensis TaxID=1329796 RepID=UPI0005CC8E0E|nr:S41 family peptidase [Risungbinella massiliensis]
MSWRGKKLGMLLASTAIISSLATAVLVDDNGFFANWLGKTSAVTSSSGEGNFESYTAKLKSTFDKIRTSSIHKVSDQQLIDGAIKGMVQSLNDPYSEYMSSEEAKQFYSELQSSFSGIGTEVTLKNGRVTVVSPIKGTPAEKSGIRSGDQIIKVDGQALEGQTIQDAVKKIRGPKGSKVTLEIHRPQSGETLQITVQRDEIPIRTIEAKMLQDKIGYIEISQFGEKTSSDFFRELENLEKQQIKGLVIDVRGNPGGYLQAVVEIGEKLLPNQKPILMTEDRSGKRETYIAKGEKKPYPITILTDRGSASASEILAASFQESGGYQVIGETSFGKGTVQRGIDFSDQSNLKLTIAKWLTPKGTWIDQHGGTKGVKPNIEVAYPEYYTVTPPVGTKVIRQDENSTQVKNLQVILDALGYNPGRKDGYFDGRTLNAVKSFQQIAGIPATGEVDLETSNRLRDAFEKFIQDPKSDPQLQMAIQTIKKNMK